MSLEGGVMFRYHDLSHKFQIVGEAITLKLQEYYLL